ncbi:MULTISPECIES: hypothetical protein [Vibrio]|nr:MULTISPECIES: hypothetical protein [Vibrio]
MRRDVFGICLSKSMLNNNLGATFTHVRAYQSDERSDDVRVMKSYPQMSGQEVLNTMQDSKSLIWRAEFCCLPMK